MVRAKFKVTRIESQMTSVAVRNDDGTQKKDERGSLMWHQVEGKTIVLHPVYSDDPKSENKKFWDASPNGELRLGTVNPAAWQEFELDREYYIDFHKA